MDSTLELGFFTSNIGKVASVTRLLAPSTIKIDLFRIPAHDEVVETDSSEFNSIHKALAGSKACPLAVMASDDEMVLRGLEDQDQPRAKIKRVVGECPSDPEMITHYSALIANGHDHKMEATLTTHYSIARGGAILGTVKLSYSCLLQMPPSPRWLDGRPLSAFHYVPFFGKRFIDLTEAELEELEKPQSEKLIHFVLDCIG